MNLNESQKTVLVTGGTGYIGSHTITELLLAGYAVVAFDNLSNSDNGVIKKIQLISNHHVTFIEGDIRDEAVLESIFKHYSFDAVIHFAGLKAVGESVSSPLLYYENNVSGSIILFKVMQKYGVKNIVFSSSATVYGSNAISPLKETLPTGTPNNPYGMSKLIIEKILKDIFFSDKEWSIAILRYFNPVGAHKSAIIGENPTGTPNNLMPLISRTAAGLDEFVNIYGNDYNTPDGTGVRDYIHVVDLAEGHVKALDKVLTQPNLITANLGTGRGYSVLELINTFERASNIKINRKFVARRIGDVDISVACPEYANSSLGWVAKYDLFDMCKDSWRWQCSMIN
ncbi:UDP-glucose 4-epimerase GalE [Amylibacter sp.]|nr:UDP-glucose 4-epimerase GalE [Amylibacter sp.]